MPVPIEDQEVESLEGIGEIDPPETAVPVYPFEGLPVSTVIRPPGKSEVLQMTKKAIVSWLAAEYDLPLWKLKLMRREVLVGFFGMTVEEAGEALGALVAAAGAARTAVQPTKAEAEPRHEYFLTRPK